MVIPPGLVFWIFGCFSTVLGDQPCSPCPKQWRQAIPPLSQTSPYLLLYCFLYLKHFLRNMYCFVRKQMCFERTNPGTEQVTGMAGTGWQGGKEAHPWGRRGRKGPVVSSSCGVWGLGGGSEGIKTGEATGWKGRGCGVQTMEELEALTEKGQR